MSIQNAEFHADLKSVGITGKTWIQKKLFVKNFCKLEVLKGTDSNFAHFFVYNFFVDEV
jgi:hypothetical protein